VRSGRLTGAVLNGDCDPPQQLRLHKTQFKLVFAGDAGYRESHSNVITLLAVK
jgi:hypothetical protein